MSPLCFVKSLMQRVPKYFLSGSVIADLPPKNVRVFLDPDCEGVMGVKLFE